MLLPVSQHYNSTGADVRTIQQLLNRYGANLIVDGDFGPKTDAAVRAFQSSHDLEVDGIVGPETWAALSSASSSGSTQYVSMHQNSSGSQVREIQTLLNQHGANLVVDGIFGSLTDAAVRAFQSSHGLEVDGIVGPQTLAALKQSSNGDTPPPPSGNATVQGILDLARSQIGTGENPSGSNQTKYGEWYGMNGVPWCAIFVSWVFDHAGIPLAFTTSKGFAYCPYGVAAFQARRQWHVSNPQPGDVVFFNWDGGAVDHVGIVESVNRDGSINTLEGNTSNNKVERRHRTESITGYGRPKYPN